MDRNIFRWSLIWSSISLSLPLSLSLSRFLFSLHCLCICTSFARWESEFWTSLPLCLSLPLTSSLSLAIHAWIKIWNYTLLKNTLLAALNRSVRFENLFSNIFSSFLLSSVPLVVYFISRKNAHFTCALGIHTWVILFSLYSCPVCTFVHLNSSHSHLNETLISDVLKPVIQTKVDPSSNKGESKSQCKKERERKRDTSSTDQNRTSPIWTRSMEVWVETFSALAC